jgi:hypothetical protein
MNNIQISTCNELFNKCPVATALFNVSNLKLEHANPSMLKWGRDNTVVGLSLLEFLPEVESLGYDDLMRIVGRSDSAYREEGAKVEIVRQGVLQPVYMDYAYTPIKAINRISVGILVTATELSEKYINSLSGEEYKRNLRALVMSAPVPMCIFRGWKLDIEAVNSHMLDLWQSHQYRNMRTIINVFHSGHFLEYTEHGIKYSCTPLRNEQGNSVGCVLIANYQSSIS